MESALMPTHDAERIKRNGFPKPVRFSSGQLSDLPGFLRLHLEEHVRYLL